MMMMTCFFPPTSAGEYARVEEFVVKVTHRAFFLYPPSKVSLVSYPLDLRNTTFAGHQESTRGQQSLTKWRRGLEAIVPRL